MDATGAPTTLEWVTLVDGSGQPCGAALKDAVHHRDTPLHLAFSCWAFDEDGRTLLTRRAASKRTWPGVWTNTFCGHPAPWERVVDAVHRRAAQELGVGITQPQLLLPDFRYRAVMPDGTVENEVCPVFHATLLGTPQPDPAEVGALRWVGTEELLAAVAREPHAHSPWMREQLQVLTDRPAADGDG